MTLSLEIFDRNYKRFTASDIAITEELYNEYTNLLVDMKETGLILQFMAIVH